MASLPAWYLKLCPANDSPSVKQGWKGNEYFPKPIELNKFEEEKEL